MTTGATLIWAIGLLVIVVFVVAVLRKRRSCGGAQGKINEQIYVGNLPYRVTESDLRRYFSKFGMPQSVRIIRNFKTGESRGYAFVTYDCTDEARSALAAHGDDMQGRPMVVRIAKPRQA